MAESSLRPFTLAVADDLYIGTHRGSGLAVPTIENRVRGLGEKTASTRIGGDQGINCRAASRTEKQRVMCLAGD
jgi:hypothetical protein